MKYNAHSVKNYLSVAKLPDAVRERFLRACEEASEDSDKLKAIHQEANKQARGNGGGYQTKVVLVRDTD